MKKLMLTLISIVLLTSFKLFSQDDFYIHSFKNEKGHDIQAKINNKTGSALFIYGLDDSIEEFMSRSEILDEDQLNTVASKIFIKHKSLLKVKPNEFRLKKQNTDGTLHFIEYQQTYKGLPIFQSYIGFTIGTDWRIVSLGSKAHENIFIDVAPQISSDRAFEIAKEKFKNTNENLRHEVELGVFPLENDSSYDYHLAWRIQLKSKIPLRNTIFFIDALTGLVLDEEEQSCSGTLNLSGQVTGNSWPKYTESTTNNPFSLTGIKVYNIYGQQVGGSYSCDANGNYSLSISGIATGTYIVRFLLKNNWVSVFDCDNGDCDDGHVTQKSYTIGLGTFQFSPLFEAGDAANIFRHVNRMHDFFKGGPFFFNDMDYQMDARFAAGTAINGEANGEDITFGSYDGKAWARSSDVVCHEYTHNTIYHIYGEFIHTGYGTEAFAMDEGISDYFASTINGDANHAEDIGGTRTLQNNFSWDPSQPDPVHWNGQVIGGAIWNLRQTVGQNVADNLAFKALQMVPHARSFQQFLENMLVVDGNIYGASHQNQIISAFSAHGINTAPLLVASITGPTNVAQNTSATWYANVSGGTGVYQYEWLKSGVYIGSGSSVSTVVNDVFTLKLKATSGAQTTYATIQVHPDASGGGCPYIFADTETGWIMDNNILHRSEFVQNRGRIIQDFYKLNVIPTKTDHGYKIQIKELNSDHSYLDEFNLYAVDHSPNITIGVTEDNHIVQYLSDDLILADEITFENSENLHSGTNQIKNSKGDMMHVKFSSDKMNRLKTAQFESASTKQAALFIDFHSFNFLKPPGKESALQVQDNSQLNKSNSMKLEVARREQGSAVIIPLKEDVNLNDIKIHWNRESAFGRIGLVPITDIDSKQLLALKSAMHSKHGDVIRKLNTADNLFSELNESETIDLTFEAPSDLNEKLIRSFILETNGYYVVPGETESVIPKEFGLEQNYPNPFNPTTTIPYNLKENTKVTLTIYNTLGQVVKTLVDKEETAGIKNISWDGKDEHGKQVASGVYIYKLKTGNLVFSRKMIFIK